MVIAGDGDHRGETGGVVVTARTMVTVVARVLCRKGKVSQGARGTAGVAER
ncbi:hypothetical protein ABT352_13145 [Streptosporangium sp. NPDC000563]|uniref:hypothetical protein n=1 Tax=unclassified Streptosporangium TaxID=2632669 RepID=UPI0033296EC1